MIKVEVNGNFYVKGSFEPPTQFSLKNGASLKDLLLLLDEKCDSLEIMEENEFGSDVWRVSINGEEKLPVSDILKRPLKDGDKIYIEVWTDPLGGG